MEHHMKLITICLAIGLLVISVGFVESCGHTFHVGGKNGWVVDPRESYNHWAERNRFQVNDTLVFKYKKGSDSVLVVNQEAYYSCNKTNPQQTLDNGNSVFKFTRSGPFFFISGHDTKCENGQKLIVVVMAVRHHTRSVNSTGAPPTPAPKILVPAPAAPPTPAPTTIIQGTDTPNIHAPAPATSSAASTHVVHLILVLGLGLNLVLKGF